MKKLQKCKYRKKKIRMMNCIKKQSNFRRIINKKVMKVLMIMIKILNRNLNVLMT